MPLGRELFSEALAFAGMTVGCGIDEAPPALASLARPPRFA